ncbi:MAG: cell division protein FtsA [Chloroflexi bacterium]|nr:cell division protein FtsA [Chloroflexota bacterium]
MAKRNTVVSIDVGTTKICTTIAEVLETGLQIVGVGLTTSNGLHKGIVVNINDAKEAIRESVARAEQSCGYRVESAYVGVTGRQVNSTNNQGVISINRNDRLVRTDDLRRVLQSSQSLKVPSDRKLLHVIPRSYAIDGEVVAKNPVGMHGFRLDVETHVITAAMSSIQNLAKCVRGIGVDIDDLVLEPLASGEAVLNEQERQNGVMMVDIGGGTTDIAIFKDGSIWHTAILPVAGYQLTRDIAIGLGVPFDVAEQMKKKYGSVMPVYEGSQIDPNKTIAQNGHAISYQDLNDIVKARVEEMLRLVMLELPRNEYQTTVPSGLVLTGGSSNLPGIDVLARELMPLPVRIGTPARMNGLSDTLHNPAYATSVGLLLWGAKNGPQPNWTPRRFGGNLRGLVSKLRGLFH